ncbi:uncharacterized protein LOC130140307 [Syzygium oleosum]|uniref:uncharacterized protein LOC130140307 n=1 Tax=Syzygium oleosum TaxID=219896 RepID=UPI0024BB33F8|nr:uncharacterized protein LOC130140307 [Syzygium oleosum]
MPFVNPCEVPRVWGTTSYNLASEEETAAAYVYKMDKTWLTADQVRVEIRWGYALWVIGHGDEPVEVELPRNSEMMVREATASMSPGGVLTIVIPKRQRPRKWYEFTDLVFSWFETVHVGISS